MILEAVLLVGVGALWGCTNPLIKHNSKSMTKIKTNSYVKQFFLELLNLATNIKYLIPMALNQCGSVLYFITLQSADLSLTVPVANSLTFAFTAITGWILGEALPNRNSLIGIALVFFGTTLCCYDKYMHSP